MAQRSYAQHFLTSATLARELVARAGVSRADRVVELGPGRGALTHALAERAAHVLAIEIDPALVAELATRFESTPAVTIVHADALDVPMPATPFRVLANVPFNRTSAILHRLLDDPTSGLTRADLVVQWQVARERARVSNGPPLDLLGATWGPWWTFARGRRLPASLFRPAPSVDAAMLVVARRGDPMLSAGECAPYRAFVRAGFERDPNAAASDVTEWVARFERAP